MLRIHPFLATLLLAIGCTPAEVGAPADTFEIDATLTANPHSELSAIVAVETSEPCRVAVGFQSDATAQQLTGRSSEGTSHEIAVVGMRANSDYTLIPIAYIEDEEAGRATALDFTTGGVPDDVPDFEVVVHDGDQVQPGVTIFGPVHHGDLAMKTFLVGVDEEGEVVWYHTASEGDAFVVDRMARALPSGTLLTMGFDLLREISVRGETVAEVRADQADLDRFHHDVIQMPQGTLLSLAQELRDVDVPSLGGIVSVQGDVVVEVDGDGEVVWEWSTFDHLDTTRFPTDLSRELIHDDFYDWTHANAVAHIEAEDALLLSLRHQHWVVKIDRATGEILWRFGPEGDIELAGDGAWFYGQHTPELGAAGEMLLYDNGNDRPDADPYSRAVAYQLDEASAEATQQWEYRTSHFTEAMGDVERLANGNVLVCAGGAFEDGTPAQIVEVTSDPSPVEVWDLTVSGHVIYRATRVESLYFAEVD